MSLYDFFGDALIDNSNGQAVRYDDGVEITSVTYSELFETIQKISEEINIQVGVYGFMMAADLNYIALMLSVMRGHGIFMSVNMELMGRKEKFEEMRNVTELRYIFTDSPQVVLFLQTLHEVQVKSLALSGVFMVTLPSHVNSNIFSPTSHNKSTVDIGNRIIYIVSTSGSTGIPKIVFVPNKCIIPNITHISKLFDQTASDISFLSSPMSFDPSFVQIFTTFNTSSCLLITTEDIKSNPAKLIEVLHARNKASVLALTPSLLKLLHLHLKTTLLSTNSFLRVLALGGERCPGRRELEAMRQKGNCTRIFNLYGITEVSCWATVSEVVFEGMSGKKNSEVVKKSDKECEEEIGGRDGEMTDGRHDNDDDDDILLGNLLEGTILELRNLEDNDDDDDGEDKEHDTRRGVLWIGGADRICVLSTDKNLDYHGSVMRCSGDVVRRERDGGLYWEGRVDGVVKRMGKRIQLGSVDLVLSSFNNVSNTSTIFHTHLLVSFVTLKHPHGFHVAAVRELLKRKLCEESQPDKIIIITNMPVNKHGKTDKTKLRSMLDSIHSEAGLWSSSYVLDVTDNPSSREFYSATRPMNPSLKPVEYFQRLVDIYLGDSKKDDKTEKTKNHEDMIEDQKGFSKDKRLSFKQLGGSSIVAVAVVNQLRKAFPSVGGFLLDKLLNGERLDVAINYLKEFVTGWDSGGGSSEGGDGGDNNNDAGRKSSDVVIGIDSVNRKSLNISTSDNQEPIIEFKKQKLEPRKTKNIKLKDEVLIISRFERVKVNLYDDYLEFSKIKSYADNSITGSFNDGRNKTSVKLDVKWKFNLEKCIDASPVIVTTSSGSSVLIGSHSHRFARIDLATGSQIWWTELKDRIEASACITYHAKYAVIGCYSGFVYKIDMKRGKIEWVFSTESCVKSTPVIVYEKASQIGKPLNNGKPLKNGKSLQIGESAGVVGCEEYHVFVGCYDQCVYKLDVEREICVWKVNLQSGGIFASMHYIDGGDDMEEDGEKKIDKNKSGEFDEIRKNGGANINDEGGANDDDGDGGGCGVGAKDDNGGGGGGLLLCCTLGGDVCAVALHAPKVKWRLSLNQAIFSSPTSTSTLIIVATVQHSIYAISKLQHTIVWQYKTQDAIFSSPVVCTHQNSQLLIIACHDSILRCLKVSSGKLIWKTILPAPIYSTPCLFHRSSERLSFEESVDSVVVSTTKGRLMMLDLTSGDHVASYCLGGEVFSSGVGIGEIMVWGCRDNYVYAFEVTSFDTVL